MINSTCPGCGAEVKWDEKLDGDQLVDPNGLVLLLNGTQVHHCEKTT